MIVGKRGNLVSFNFQRTTHCHDTHQAEVSPVAAPRLPLAWTTCPRTLSDRSQNFWKKFRAGEFVGMISSQLLKTSWDGGYLCVFSSQPQFGKSEKRRQRAALDSGGDWCDSWCTVISPFKHVVAWSLWRIYTLKGIISNGFLDGAQI